MNIRVVFILALTMSALMGCKSNSINSDSTYSGQAGYEEFVSGFYTWAQSQGCVRCHGSSQTPKFASSDVGYAYEEAKTRIDFNSPTTSPIINHSGNGHCGLSICSGSANQAIVLDLLTAWANAELSGNVNGGPILPPFVTASLNIPDTLPMANQAPALLRFPLSQLNPPVPYLSNAIFEVEIQMWNATDYRITRPKIGEITTAVAVSGIHVYVGDRANSGVGAEDTAQGDLWNDLSDIAPIYDIPNYPSVLPTGPLGGNSPPAGLVLTMPSLFIQKHVPQEKITIGFESFQQTVYPPVVPFSSVQSIVNARCVTCHTGIPTNATPAQYQSTLNIGGGGGTTVLVVPGTPERSRLYMSLSGVVGATNDMPQGQTPLSQAERDTILNYILGL